MRWVWCSKPECTRRTSRTGLRCRWCWRERSKSSLAWSTYGLIRDTRALARRGSRSSLDGASRWSSIRLILQCYLYIGYEATASSPELEHFHYALPETFFAPLAVATVYRSPRPELLFR